MRLLLTADWHLHMHRVGSRDGGIDRLEDGIRALTASFELAVKHDAVWVGLGDFKEPRTSWPQEALVRALDAFRAAKTVTKLMLPGNHDWRSEYGTGLSPFKAIENTFVIEEPEVRRFSGCRIAVWPYWIFLPRHQAEWAEAMTEAQGRGATILLSHGFMAGVLLGPDETRLAGKGLTRDLVGSPDTFKLVCLGDIHQAQILTGRPMQWKKIGAGDDVRGPGPFRGEILYPGSPYAQNWGERNARKGALLVDLVTGYVQFFQLPGPRFLLFDWTQEKKPAAPEDGCWQDDIVRVLVISDFPRKIREALQKRTGARSLEFVPVHSVETKARTTIHAGMSKGQLLEEYVKARPLEGVASSKLVKAGKDLLDGDR